MMEAQAMQANLHLVARYEKPSLRVVTTMQALQVFLSIKIRGNLLPLCYEIFVAFNLAGRKNSLSIHWAYEER